MLEALALHFHRGEDQAVPYEMRGVSHSFASFKTGNNVSTQLCKTHVSTRIFQTNIEKKNKISYQSNF